MNYCLSIYIDIPVDFCLYQKENVFYIKWKRILLLCKKNLHGMSFNLFVLYVFINNSYLCIRYININKLWRNIMITDINNIYIIFFYFW